MQSRQNLGWAFQGGHVKCLPRLVHRAFRGALGPLITQDISPSSCLVLAVVGNVTFYCHAINARCGIQMDHELYWSWDKAHQLMFPVLKRMQRGCMASLQILLLYWSPSNFAIRQWRGLYMVLLLMVKQEKSKLVTCWRGKATVTEREAANSTSLVGGQGVKRCGCPGLCYTKRCACKQEGRFCGSACHGGIHHCWTNNEKFMAM